MMHSGKGSDSLRAVLLSAKCQSGSGSKPSSTAVTWQSLRSVGPTVPSDPPGHYFPAKLALALGLLKIFFGLIMMGFGAVAIVMKASISSIGAGVWVGVIVGVSGFLGVCAAKRPYVHVYVISFMSVSILAVAASGLLIVLSATAWARDSQNPHMIIYDTESESEVDLFGEFLVRKPSILVSGLLVVLGVFDILTSLACVALSAREACGIYSQMGVFANHDGHDKKERLYRWLGQQKNIFQVVPSSTAKNIASVSQFVPLTSSGVSSIFRKQPSFPLSPSAEPLLRSQQRIRKKSSPGSSGKSGTSSGNFHEAANGKSRKETKKLYSDKKNSTVFLYPEVDYELKAPVLVKRKEKVKLPPPQGPCSLPPMLPITCQRHPCFRERNQYIRQSSINQHMYTPIYPQEIYVQNGHHRFHSLPPHHHQLYSQHPAVFYPHVKTPAVTYYSPLQGLSASEERKELRKLQRTGRKKERKRKYEKKKLRAEKKHKPLTDQQIENTYTGLDREIAEGFIAHAMEPGVSRRKSSFE